MKTIQVILITAAIIGFTACAQKESKADYGFGGGSGAGSGAVSQLNLEAADLSAAPESTEPSVLKKNETITEQKLIKNGDIAFETKSIKDSKVFLQKTIAKYKGYISNEKIEDYRTNPTEILTVRVPNNQFDNLIHEIGQQVGEFDSKRIDIEDVTAEFVDIEARLKNKKQLEAKYQELLAKANNMADILKIEKEISLIREDIESTEGRLRYLSNQVGYSTLIITYYERKASSGFHFGSKLSDALSNGGTGLLWFLIIMVQLWPMWLIGGILWYIIRKWIKRSKNKNLQEKTVQ